MTTIYEKVSETEGKIIKPSENVTSLSDLKKNLEDALLARERMVKDNIERLSTVDAYISELQANILGFKNIGVKEKLAQVEIKGSDIIESDIKDITK